MQTLGQLAYALESARTQRRMTYDELARGAGLTPLATRRAMQGTAAPRITTLMALAGQLGMEVVLVPRVVAQGLESAETAAPRPLTDIEKLARGEPRGGA